MSTRRISVEIVADAAQFERQMTRAASASSKFDKDIGRAGKGAIAASIGFKGLGRNIAFASAQFLGAAGFVAVVKKSVDEAGKLEDQLARTEKVFKSSAGTVKQWSKDSAEALGLSQSAALDAANTIGTLLTNVGQAPRKAAAMSKQMVQLAADMAAFKKVKPEEALYALESGLQGRTRSLKQFGVTIDQAAIKEEAYRDGIAKTVVSTKAVQDAETKVAIARAKLANAEQKYASNTTQVAQARLTLSRAEDAVAKAQAGSSGQLTAAQKALATYQLILRQTRNEQGAFKDSSDELAVIEQKLHAQFQNIEATVGQALLPVMEKYGNELDQWIEKEQKSGAIQREVAEAVHLLSGAIQAGEDVVKVATGLFHGLSEAVGGDKHAIELLVGAFLTLKTAQVANSIGFPVTKLAGIGGAATTAEGEVTGLRAALLGLGDASVLSSLGALGAAIAAAMAAGKIDQNGGYTPNAPPFGGHQTHTGSEGTTVSVNKNKSITFGKDGSISLNTQHGAIGGSDTITLAQAAKLLGMTIMQLRVSLGQNTSGMSNDPMHDAGGGNTRPTAAAAAAAARGNYRTYAAQMAQLYGVPQSLFLAQINQESGFNPNALSSAGAIGIAQFMPGTAAGMGVNPHDPKSSLEGAAKMMAGLYAKYGSWAAALSAYNSGSPTAYLNPSFAKGQTYNYVKNILLAAGMGYDTSTPDVSGPGTLVVGTTPHKPKKPPKPKVISGSALIGLAAVSGVFGHEGPDLYKAAYSRNAPFAVPSGSNYQTKLSAAQEKRFRAWVKQNNVPFDVNAKNVDYDMRGYWLAMTHGQAPKWAGGATHFPDTFKTPYDTTFSAESKYATKNNPFVWKGNNLVDSRSGLLIYGKESGVDLASRIATLADKAKNAKSVGNDSLALAYLQAEAQDLDAAKRAVSAKAAKMKAGKQKTAATAEADALGKNLRDVQAQIEKAQRAISDSKFAAAVKSQVSKFIASTSSLDKRYTDLVTRSQYDTGQALTDDYAAIAKNLGAQKSTLQAEVAKLNGMLAGKDKSQRAAISAQITRVTQLLSNVGGEIQSNLQNQYQALSQAVSDMQSKTSSAWSTYSGEIVSEFETGTQKLLDQLAANPAFFQNGALTPSEKKLQDMQGADQLDQLNQSISDAKDQLAKDTSAAASSVTDSAGQVADAATETVTNVSQLADGITLISTTTAKAAKSTQDATAAADQSTIDADKKAITAAQRQLDEYELGVKAQQERTAADTAYAAAVQKLTDQRTVQEQELNKVLGQFGDGLVNGSLSISQLQGWLDGANPEGWAFGINLAAVNAQSPVVASDFKDLSGYASDLISAFSALIAWIDAQTGSSVQAPAVVANANASALGAAQAAYTANPSTSNKAAVLAAAAAAGYTQSAGFLARAGIVGGGSGTAASLAAALDPTGVTRRPGVQLADGGIVVSPTIALIGEGREPEAVVPLSRAGQFGFGAGGPVAQLTLNVLDDKKLAARLAPYIDPESRSALVRVRLR